MEVNSPPDMQSVVLADVLPQSNEVSRPVSTIKYTAVRNVVDMTRGSLLIIETQLR